MRKFNIRKSLSAALLGGTLAASLAVTTNAAGRSCTDHAAGEATSTLRRDPRNNTVLG